MNRKLGHTFFISDLKVGDLIDSWYNRKVRLITDFECDPELPPRGLSRVYSWLEISADLVEHTTERRALNIHLSIESFFGPCRVLRNGQFIHQADVNPCGEVQLQDLITYVRLYPGSDEANEQC